MTTVLTEHHITEEEFRRISDMVYDHCRINLHDGKKDLVRARLAKRLRMGNFASVSEYLDFLKSDESGREFTALIDSLSTNLTSFFRESVHFDYLRERILPELRTNRQHRDSLRAWSAGCSTGEEAYSLAMTLLDDLGDGWDIRLLATDISTRVLAAARRGIYPAARVDSVPPLLRQKYFRPIREAGSKMYEVTPELRRVVHFRYLNLMDQWPFRGPFDFIFCRNVMIYFDKPTQQDLVERFHQLLRPGGLLFTGHSESLTGITHRFRYVQPSVYAKA